MVNVDNISYYLDDSGKMLANTTVNVNGTDYNIDSSGAMTPVVAENTSTTVEPTSATVSTRASVGPVAN